MTRYIIIRIFKSILTIFIVFTLVFFLTRMTGDPIEWLTNAGASEKAINIFRQSLGLDLPLGEQYMNSLKGFFTGDSGTSYYYARQVSDLFAERLAPTLSLGGITLLVTMLIGVPLGVLAAWKRNSILDRSLMTTAIIGNTIPSFVLGLLLIFLFALRLRMLPSGGRDSIRHYILPVVALSVGPISGVARLTRSSMLDEIGLEYLDAARARGQSEIAVLLKHALRNAMIPVITILGSQTSAIIGGSVVVETVFAWPGIGTLIVSAARNRDFPVVIFGVIVIAASVTLVNLLVDLSYGILDPRIRPE